MDDGRYVSLLVWQWYSSQYLLYSLPYLYVYMEVGCIHIDGLHHSICVLFRRHIYTYIFPTRYLLYLSIRVWPSIIDDTRHFHLCICCVEGVETYRAWTGARASLVLRLNLCVSPLACACSRVLAHAMMCISVNATLSLCMSRRGRLEDGGR